jgi:hypothetical protein
VVVAAVVAAVVAIVPVLAPWQALVLVVALALVLVVALALVPADLMQTRSWNSFFWLWCDFNMIIQKK